MKIKSKRMKQGKREKEDARSGSSPDSAHDVEDVQRLSLDLEGTMDALICRSSNVPASILFINDQMALIVIISTL